MAAESASWVRPGKAGRPATSQWCEHRTAGTHQTNEWLIPQCTAGARQSKEWLAPPFIFSLFDCLQDDDDADYDDDDGPALAANNIAGCPVNI